MSKRKRPKEEFLADLRPLKRRLTWKDAINRVFKEYPNGFLMGKDQIKNEFLSIHKIDKLKIESPNERIEDEFEKKLKEFTDQDILFKNQNVYALNPQISTTTDTHVSQCDILLTNDNDKTESKSNNEKLFSDLENIEKEINETYSNDSRSHDDEEEEEEEISDEEDDDNKEDNRLKEAIKLILNEMNPNEKFFSSTVRKTLEKKIERNEINLDSESTKRYSLLLYQLHSSSWKTASGNILFKQKMTKKEKQKLSANNATTCRNVFWLSNPEDKEEEEYGEEEDFNLPTYKSVEDESIEKTLKENGGKMMSSNQIFNKSQIRFGTQILSRLIKKYSLKPFGVKRIKLNKEMKKRWKRKYKIKGSPTFLYYYQEKGKKEKKELEKDFDDDVIPIELEIKEILKNKEEGMSEKQIFRELVSKKKYSKSNDSFNKELNIIIKKSDILRKVPCKGKLKKKWLKKNKDENRRTKNLYFIKKKKTLDESNQNIQKISNEEEEVSMNEAIKLILNEHDEMNPNEKFLSSSILKTLEKKIKRKEIILDTEIPHSISLSYIPSTNWKTSSGNKLFKRRITKKEKEIMSAHKYKCIRNIYWLGKPKNKEEEEEYVQEEDFNIPTYKSIEKILKENGGKMMSSNQILNSSQQHSMNTIASNLLRLIEKYSSQNFGVKRIKLNKEMKKRWNRKYKIRTFPTFLYYYQEEGSEEQKELEQDFDDDVPLFNLELEIKEIIKNNKEGMSLNQIYKELISKKKYSKPKHSFNKELSVIIKKSDILRKVPCEGKLKKKWSKKNKNENVRTKFLYFIKKKEERRNTSNILQEQIQIPPPPPILISDQQQHHHDCFENLNVLTISPKTKITERNGFNILDVIEEKKSNEFSSKTEIIEYFDKINHVKLLKTIKCNKSMKQIFNKLSYLKKIRINELLLLEEIQEKENQNSITEIHLIYESFGTCGIEISKLNKKQIKILIKKTLKNIQNLLNLGISCFINISDIFYKITEQENEVKFLLWNNFEFCNFGESGREFISHIKRFFNNLFLLVGIKNVFGSDLNQFNNFNEVFNHVQSLSTNQFSV